jgi:hypothetical protein
MPSFVRLAPGPHTISVGTISTGAVAALLLAAGCSEGAGRVSTRGRDAGTGARTDAHFARNDGAFGALDGQDELCASVELVTRRVIPDVTIIVDQSLSMENELADGVTRWDAVDAVLTGPDGLVTTTGSVVRYGLALYSDVQHGSPMCPIVTQVPLSLENRDAIDAAYARADPMGETPTGDAIEAVLESMTLDPTDAPRVFVLATDGGPDRCGAPDAHDEISRDLSLRAVRRAHELGIRTFVVGVGRGTVAADHLADLAAAGRGGVASPYYEADDVASLAEAMRTIVRGEVSCTLALEGRIDPAAACEGRVRLDGDVIACGDPDGWRVVDESHIELVGASCDALIENERSSVEASFPCTVVLI